MELIRCPSVTPEDAGAQVFLDRTLSAAGFSCHHLPFGDVPNLFARFGTGGPHLCYAGHTDVVPPGPESAWTSPPFSPEIRDGVLYGRGASDMKGSVAAFTAASLRFVTAHPEFGGSISMLITGDEEGEGIDGTLKVLEWMKANGHVPDVALVGEPTNPDFLGQEIKIGRRGSLTCALHVEGRQGHVAYPHLADNPMPHLAAMICALSSHVFDTGTEFFQPTNLEVTTVDMDNKADNVIPARARALFNIRYNNLWTEETLLARLHEILDGVSDREGRYSMDHFFGSKCFMTAPGAWSGLVREAVKDVTGHTPAFTTNGGTSDARYVHNYCPVVEFGGINKTIHQIDENAAVDDLQRLSVIFERILERYFGVGA